jgi:hypothetical protein
MPIFQALAPPHFSPSPSLLATFHCLVSGLGKIGTGHLTFHLNLNLNPNLNLGSVGSERKEIKIKIRIKIKNRD